MVSLSTKFPIRGALGVLLIGHLSVRYRKLRFTFVPAIVYFKPQSHLRVSFF